MRRPMTVATRARGIRDGVVELCRMRHRQTVMTRFGCAVLLVVLAAGCSSSRPSARGSSSSTTVASLTNGASTTPQAAATALANRLLEQALLPPGARPTNVPAPSVVRGPNVPAIANLEDAHQAWTVNADAHAEWQWLERHRGADFHLSGTESGNDGGVPSWGVTDELRALPPNVSYAAVAYEIARSSVGGAYIRVDATVGWTTPRPAAELLSASDRVVIVTVIHVASVPGKRVVVTDAGRVGQIVRAFNQLRVAPSSLGGEHGCRPSTRRTVSYRVAFATAARAAPTAVATLTKCGPIGVSVDGRELPSLNMYDSAGAGFANEVARILGFTELHFG